MKLNKFDEENLNLSNHFSNNISKDDSKFGLLKKLDSESLFTNFPFNSKEIRIISQEKNQGKDHFSKSLSKSYKEDENISDVHQISYDKRQSEEEHYNRRGKQDINRRLMKKEKICDTDTEDEGSESENSNTKWILLPDDLFKRMWDLLISLIILYSSIVIPYKISFVDEPQLEEVDIAFDVCLGLDIIVNFFSAYIDNEDNLIKDRKQIVKNYLKTWFTIDIISILPVSYFTDNGFKFNNLTRIGRLPKLYRLVKLTKLLRMSRIAKKGNVSKLTKFLMEKFKVNSNIERLIYFILAFLLLNHISACIWFFMAKLQDLSPDCWVTRLGYIDASNFEIYVVSFYWTLTTVTTVGYGDVNAGTTIERGYNLIIMSFGVLMYSFAIGSLSSIVSTLDAKTAEMNQKLQILSSIKKEFNLEQDIYDKVRKVIKYDLSRNQKDKMIFLQELPNKLRIELSQIMHDKAIQNLYFFKDQPKDFIAYVAPLLKPVKFSQDDYLYKQGDMIDEMYFVAKGTVILCLPKKYDEKEITEIKKNNNFGEIEMCLNEKLEYDIKIKSRNCELFVLKKNDFLRLSVNFKEFIENFLYKSLMKFLKFSDIRKKMIKDEENKMNKINVEKNKNINSNNLLEKVNEEKEDQSEIFYSEASSVQESEEEEQEEQKYTNNQEITQNKEILNKISNEGKKNKNEDFNSLRFKDENNFSINNPSNKNTMSKEKSQNEDKKEKSNPDTKSKENVACNSDDSVDKYKNNMNKKFIKKIDKILEYLEENGIEFNNEENNPKNLLKKLKVETNIIEKNNIMDKIESFLKEFYKDSKQ